MSRLTLYAALLCLIACCTTAVPAQEEIKKRQAELGQIRERIRQFEGKIKEQQQNEQETLELLDTYERKGDLLSELIGKLRSVEQMLQRRIEQTKSGMTKLEAQMNFLKAHYARYMVSVYKSGRIHDLELLLSSASINQFTIRNEYLKRFSAQRKKDADKIIAKREEIAENQARLQQQLGEERRLIAEKATEEDRLATLAADRRDVLQQIRKDKNLTKQAIERQTKAARELENILAGLIEAERLKKARRADEARKLKLPQPEPVAGDFHLKKGKLRWPVGEGTVVARFGNQRHPTLKTITLNLGIDIAVKPGSPVSAVAEGEVTKILWLPSYGNLLIINHYGGYWTVYTHLAEIDVVEGQKVKEGDVIATSGEGLDGPRIHFEIWKDREKQNPEQWLSKQ